MDRFTTGTPAERLVGRSFSTEELRLLFVREDFRAALDAMVTLEDAERLIEFGEKIIRGRLQKSSVDRKTDSPGSPQVFHVSSLPDDIHWDEARMISFEESRMQVYDGSKVTIYEFESRDQLEKALQTLARKQK